MEEWVSVLVANFHCLTIIAEPTKAKIILKEPC